MLNGYQINDEELNLLFNTAGEKINDIADVANQLNFLKNGNKVSLLKTEISTTQINAITNVVSVDFQKVQKVLILKKNRTLLISKK